MQIEYNGKLYVPDADIPVSLGSLVVGNTQFRLKFFCTSKCQKISNLQLGLVFFLGIKNTTFSARQYCDLFYPIEMKK